MYYVQHFIVSTPKLASSSVFFPHAKAINFEIGQIDHVVLLLLLRKQRWLILFKITGSSGLSGCWDTLSVKGLIAKGYFVEQ